MQPGKKGMQASCKKSGAEKSTASKAIKKGALLPRRAVTSISLLYVCIY
jgi:hypothetical protein